MEPEQLYRFEAELWLSGSSKAAWHFVTVPAAISHRIRFMAGKTSGFGSIRVFGRIGDCNWATSLFPDKASCCYFLPVKADVRRIAAVAVGDIVSVELQIV